VNCASAQNLLHAYLDGELDLVRSLELEHHLAECPDCAARHEALRSLGEGVRAADLYHRAPAGLRDRVRTALARAAPPPPRRLPRRWLVASALAASVLFLALGASALLLSRPPSPGGDRLAEEVVANHARSLLAQHITDIESADGHVVKPWLDRQLDYAAPVTDLAEHGFPLTGGRLDYLDNHRVAALVYKRHEHLINLFVWPASGAPDSAPRTTTRRGYHLVTWTKAGFNYRAISDLNEAELLEFARLLREPS
jgi:anti-sigma factor RsiW